MGPQGSRGHTLRTATVDQDLSWVWEMLWGGGEGRVDCSSYRLIQTPHPCSKKPFTAWPLFFLPPMLQWPGSDNSFAHSLSKYWLHTYCVPEVWRHPNYRTDLFLPQGLYTCLFIFLDHPSPDSVWLSSFQSLGLSFNPPLWGQTPSEHTRKKCPFTIIHCQQYICLIQSINDTG